MIFPGTEVVLTSLQFSGSPFLLKMEQRFLFSSHWGLGLTAMTFQIPWRVALQQHQPLPSRPWDTSVHGPIAEWLYLVDQLKKFTVWNYSKLICL